jgi:diadenosine tetraphosphate (Ap4A) HIT family hydrolase
VYVNGGGAKPRLGLGWCFVAGCLACDLADGRMPLPGGVIWETEDWLVEHCVGPLGVGTLIVKPRRHVTRVSELTADEAAEVGPLLHRAAAVVDELVEPEQVYTCLWSHAGGVPVHIHYVVQPVTRALMDDHAAHGPALQVAMFTRGELPPEDEVALFADRARETFAAQPVA